MKTKLLIILFIMYGCKIENERCDNFITIDVTKKYPKKELILQDFLDIEYIQLETNNEFITSASLQDISGNIILMKDLNRANTGNIFIFNRDGNALRKINHLGQGGEEYTNILDIKIDKYNNEIFVNNLFSYQILVYDTLGNFKRKLKHKEGFFYNQIADFNQGYLICHDGLQEFNKPDIKRNCFLIISKLDGSIKEIQIPYIKKISMLMMVKDITGEIISDVYTFYNKQLIPYHNNWILIETSADTIYTYSQDHEMDPFIVRTPSIQSMNPEVFLFVGVLTNRYYFMQTVKKQFNFEKRTGFPTTELVYDRQENSIFECIVLNADFTDKRPISLVYQAPSPPAILNNDEIAFMIRLEVPDLLEAYEMGKLKGELKKIAANLNEDSNPVLMLAKYKK